MASLSQISTISIFSEDYSPKLSEEKKRLIRERVIWALQEPPLNPFERYRNWIKAGERVYSGDRDKLIRYVNERLNNHLRSDRIYHAS
jgi:hypothetical protein